MDLLETIRNRSSVRAFADEPLSREQVREVLSDARYAPSAINMQPWEVHVVMGEERKLLSRRLLKVYRERRVTCGPGAQTELPDVFMQRSRACAVGMAPLLERMGTDTGTYINEGSLDFYGAPAVILLFLDGSFPPDRMIDIGSFAAFTVLAAAGHGLASCPIGLVTSYQDAVKDHLNIEETKELVLSVALGKPTPGVPINEFRSPRAEPEEFVRWID